MLSLTSYFHFPKRESDICIVYYLTPCRFNTALWAPYFDIPTVHNVFDSATRFSWFCEVGIGYMILKYPLYRSIRTFAGVGI